MGRKGLTCLRRQFGAITTAMPYELRLIGLLAVFASLLIGGIAAGQTTQPDRVEKYAEPGAEIWLDDQVIAVIKDKPRLLGLPASVGPDIRIIPRVASEPATPPPFVAPAGMKIVRVTSGTSLRPESNTCYLPFGYESGQRATFKSTGQVVFVGNNVRNVLALACDFESTSATEDVMRTVADGCQGITFDGCSFRGGRNNVVWQAVHISGPCTTRDLAFLRCRLLSPLGAVDRSGQNAFVANVDGLTFEECFFEDAGAKQPPRGIYTHSLYPQIGNKRVRVAFSIGVNPQSCFIQARGPGNADTADPGPVITGNLSYNAPIAYMLSGPRATFTNNLGVAGPHANHKNADGTRNTLGRVMLYGSVGKLESRDNRIVRGPVLGTGFVLAEGPYRNAKRNDDWAYKGKCEYTANERNTADFSVTANLDDLVTRGRNGESVLGLLAEARRRVAGVN